VNRAAASPRRRSQVLPRPRRSLGPVAASVLTLAAWGAVAHNSGDGWVQALGALLAAFLLIGLAAPALAVRRVGCSVTSNPPDAIAGYPVVVEVKVSAGAQVRPLLPPGPSAIVPGSGTLTLVPARRGVYEACRVEIATAAPFGLLWWTKVATIPLARPLLVAPRPGLPDRSVLSMARSQGEDGLRVGSRVGEPRSVRPYQVGDLRHWVHWPATAHSRTLMVREMEGPVAQPLTVRALLPEDPDAADRQAGQALATVAGLLAAGRSVRLETLERSGPRHEEVATARDAGRRLARALPFDGLGP
jgi:uncharacterized protein (DUF58 family)